MLLWYLSIMTFDNAKVALILTSCYNLEHVGSQSDEVGIYLVTINIVLFIDFMALLIL